MAVLSLTWKSPYVDKIVFILRRGPDRTNNEHMITSIRLPLQGLALQTLSWDKLDQLERLCSEDTPRCLMINHSIDSHWIPSQKKTQSKLQI